jgi:hypothetical protein
MNTTLSAQDQIAVDVIKRAGIRRPTTVVRLARRTGLLVREAVAMLELESSGGLNVFGHDPVDPPQIQGGPVTEERYRRYKQLRAQCGAQGVGPGQLTHPPLQDRADALGGCWRPGVNMLVAFEHLAGLIRAHGRQEGFRRYNGGPTWNAASAGYAQRALQRVAVWEQRFRAAGAM